MSRTGMHIRLLVDDLELPVDFDQLESLIHSLRDDTGQFAPVLHRLAGHPVSSVRAAVAGKRQISEETVTVLAADSDPGVIESLVDSQACKLNGDVLAEIINRNWTPINRSLARNVESYDQAEPLVIAQMLQQDSDPSVRLALARNSSAPKSVLRQLAKDSYPEVSEAARESLAGR